MRLSEFDYTLPEELIAQRPLARRDRSRLMVVERASGAIGHHRFFEILDHLRGDDLLVLNNTRVIPARLAGRKSTGGRVEVLLLRRVAAGVWEAMVKPGRRVQVGADLLFDRSLSARVVERTTQGGRILAFDAEADPDTLIALIGDAPLPPYVHERLDDPERYQTVYASVDGSAAAPTAGLHLTPALLDSARSRGIQTAFITLHIGVATFRPVRTANVEDHEMHAEYVEISPECAEVINSARGRIVAVGTTTARALESAAVGKRQVRPFDGETRLYIRPPYEFKVVGALVTNFHMPRSTLLIMISAFAGVELVRRAYEAAIAEKYRFLSFGDSMFLH